MPLRVRCSIRLRFQRARSSETRQGRLYALTGLSNLGPVGQGGRFALFAAITYSLGEHEKTDV